MARQLRAVRTRQKIMEAAAAVFERRGFEAATIADILAEARVTKGALYFHFDSKEEIAEGILATQGSQPPPAEGTRIQQLVDIGFLLALRLRTDPLARASIRLTLDRSGGLDRRGLLRQWHERTLKLLVAAKEEGELLPHVDPEETAGLYVGCFAGVQLMSQTMSDYADLLERVRVMQRHFLPSIAVPGLLVSVDVSAARAELLLRREDQEE